MSVPPAVESLVADAPVSAHLATSVDDRPHVAPVWYGYRDGVVSFLTGGRKLANVRRNPRVALSIEEARGSDVAWSVTLLGTATVSDDPDRIDRAADWIYDAYDDGSGDEATDEEGAGDERRTDDGATGGDAGDDYALVEVAVRSAAWTVYE